MTYSFPLYNSHLRLFTILLKNLGLLVTQSCPTLWSHGCSPLGSSVHRILQTGILEWEAITFSRGESFQLRDQTQVSWLAGRFFTFWAPGKPLELQRYFSKFSLKYLEMIFPESQNLTKILHTTLKNLRKRICFNELFAVTGSLF